MDLNGCMKCYMAACGCMDAEVRKDLYIFSHIHSMKYVHCMWMLLLRVVWQSQLKLTIVAALCSPEFVKAASSKVNWSVDLLLSCDHVERSEAAMNE